MLILKLLLLTIIILVNILISKGVMLACIILSFIFTCSSSAPKLLVTFSMADQKKAVPMAPQRAR